MSAFDRLLPLVYEEPHRLAKRHLYRENPGHSLQTTGLVHEAYLRLVTGLSIAETAQVLGISPATVKREWTIALAWSRRELIHA